VCSKLKRHCLGIELNSKRAKESESKFLHPSKLVIGDARKTSITHNGSVNLVLGSAPFFHDISCDHEALMKYRQLISETLVYQDHLISQNTIVAIEAMLVRRKNGSVRNFVFALSQAMAESYEEIDETVFVCKERNRNVFGMDHFVVKQFKKKK